MPNGSSKGKRGRPPKHTTDNERREALNAANRRAYNRRKQASTPQRNVNELRIVFDERSILEQEGLTLGRVTAPELGIQAEDLAIPADEDLQGEASTGLVDQEFEVCSRLWLFLLFHIYFLYS